MSYAQPGHFRNATFDIESQVKTQTKRLLTDPALKYLPNQIARYIPSARQLVNVAMVPIAHYSPWRRRARRGYSRRFLRIKRSRRKIRGTGFKYF